MLYLQEIRIELHFSVFEYKITSIRKTTIETEIYITTSWKKKCNFVEENNQS